MSITITNFSIDADQWVYTSSVPQFYVDVVDAVNTITTSGTYFLVDGAQVVTTYSGINNGYRLFYTPSIISSSLNISVRGYNDIGETTTETYVLLFGYHVAFNDALDWGAGQTVVVDASASNTTTCPNTETMAFSFSTRGLLHADLSCSINATEYSDLRASIRPQSTAIFYEKTYTIIISGVKDYAGNEMKPYSFTFTIEDKP